MYHLLLSVKLQLGGNFPKVLRLILYTHMNIGTYMNMDNAPTNNTIKDHEGITADMQLIL